MSARPALRATSQPKCTKHAKTEVRMLVRGHAPQLLSIMARNTWCNVHTCMVVNLRAHAIRESFPAHQPPTNLGAPSPPMDPPPPPRQSPPSLAVPRKVRWGAGDTYCSILVVVGRETPYSLLVGCPCRLSISAAIMYAPSFCGFVTSARFTRMLTLKSHIVWL